MNEALILSGDEEKSIKEIIRNIQKEFNLPIDKFSQDVLISQIDLLLTLCNRYYKRQFITRKKPTNDILSKFELLFHKYFYSGFMEENKNPSVRYFADKLNVSPNYLSDVLRSLTGQNAQQHIHEKLIEKAKELLTSMHLSIGEIAHQLGFEYPQSFSKLLKSKTDSTPVEFRASFN
ncbi:helix-turn-helix domain-containing protein [Pedobacter endophyticus]|uniref:AraC family transcriptional regulator n=1 Tax=Pedobacter endophyticus TaxID=2789740 RepID=A0A7U3SQ94_9SPHI|nr:helix-turn-helix domain-containing protein [Pedobacter endophyticus]QPH38704.1 AraC family transcriptional regulator [Pedobacter endophyticus]